MAPGGPQCRSDLQRRAPCLADPGTARRWSLVDPFPEGNPDVPSLFITRGPDQGVRFELTDGLATIGRGPPNALPLSDREASRHHARVVPQNGSYSIEDLQSVNGTFVNGLRVDKQVLASGDQVQIGATILLYTGPAREASTELLERVQLLKRKDPLDRSRIVRAMRHEGEGAIPDGSLHPSESPWLARARSNLQVMYRTALAVSHTLDIDQLLARIMELIFEWVAADRGCVMLFDPEHQAFQPRVRQDRRGTNAALEMSISQTILDYVLEHKEGVLTSDAREDERWDAAASIVQHDVREAMCVPMQGRYDLVGVIYIDTSSPPERLTGRPASRRFSDEHLKLMIAIAHQAALAVEDTRYYSAMVQSERLAAMGQTIAMISHHVKNILQGIRGGSYLVESGLADGDLVLIRKGWSIVERRQNEISALVLDMLTYSKERQPELAADDLNRVAADAVELMRPRAEEKAVRLLWNPASELPPMLIDPDGIGRVVANLITNAIDACQGREDARVVVCTVHQPDAGQALIVVEDNGEGIPADEVSRIFNPFVSSKGSRGTGLGLPVSRKIVKEHGGSIGVTSTPQVGSRFEVRLPVTPPTEGAPPASSTS
jgi:signal transduction histidine kinase/pSer/pThr/pTyr-binding forkhead associated (FHA) protein